MDFLEIKSNALMPSSDITGSSTCREGVLERRRASLHDGVDLLGNGRRMSPATFCRAVILPTRMASITICGTWPLANCSPRRCNMRMWWDNRGR